MYSAFIKKSAHWVGAIQTARKITIPSNIFTTPGYFINGGASVAGSTDLV